MRALTRFLTPGSIAKSFCLALAFPFSLEGASLVDLIDKTAHPCENFYQYACGGWIKTHPLPKDRARLARFEELQDANLGLLKVVLEKASLKSAQRSANEQKIGDYYAACMNEEVINKAGITPIEAMLKKIDSLTNKSELGQLIAEFQGQGMSVFFTFASQQDLKKSSRIIAVVDQGGMGLPSRDYYFDTGEKAESIREKYMAHIARMLELSGVGKERATAQGKGVFAFERALADKALTPAEQRGPTNIYHMKNVKELQKLAPFLDWTDFMKAVGAPPAERINVAVIPFVENLEKLIERTKLDDLKAYLRWQLIQSRAQFLSKSVEEESFDFYGRTLLGQKEMRPRWHRCMTHVDRDLGEALGQAFVKVAFVLDSKERVLGLIDNLEKALQKDIEELPWMSAETKAKAKVKLAAIARKIGYPDEWRDYSKLEITRADFYGNALRSEAFETQRQLRKIGKAVDRKEWEMTPPTVDAYYQAQNNDINFPAGILRPPFFDRSWPDELNYGGIGMVIGHEITHGFDDQGRKFDGQGNLSDWWTKKDAREFGERTKCLVDEYGSFVASHDAKNGDVRQDGQLTLGENTADNGGIRIAWNALRDYTNALKGKSIDGLTPAQRFFIAQAQVWCAVQTDDASRLQAKTNPHSLPWFRVNGTMRNVPEFQEAFACRTGQPMAPQMRCRVW